MVVKVAMADHFQFKVMPSIKNFCLLKQGDVHYIGGTDILPAPLGASEEQDARSEERRVGKECRSRWSPYH